MVELLAGVGINTTLPTTAKPVYGTSRSYAVGIAIPSGSSVDQNWFKIIAKQNSDPGKWSTTHTGHGILRLLTYWSIHLRGQIEKLTIAAHGWDCYKEPGNLGPGIPGGPGPENTNDGLFTNSYYSDIQLATNGGACTGDLKRLVQARAINFARLARIQIYACRIAPVFAQELAAATGAIVTFAQGSCGSSTGEQWESVPKCTAERTDGRYTGFSVTVEGGTPTDIGQYHGPQ